MGEVFYAHASETATISNTFTVDGTATDPTTVTFVVTDPAGTATTYTYADAEITKVSTGVYRKDIACPTAGRWQAVIVGTGTAADVTVVTWDVFDTATSTLYCTVEQLKSRMGVGTDTHDFELRLAVATVSREIDEWCHRHFFKTSATRTFAAQDGYRVLVGDLVSPSTVKTDGAGDGTFETTWAEADYQLRPTDAGHRAEAFPYTELRAVASKTFPRYSGHGLDNQVEVTGVFGWPQVPMAVQQAALILAAELTKLKDAPFGVAGFGEFGAVRIRNNPKATALLAPYRRTPILVG